MQNTRFKLTKLMAFFLLIIAILVTAKGALGEVVINEIMQDPSSPVSDAEGEWIELYNNGSAAIDINGWIIRDDDTNTHTIANGATLNISPNGFLILCRDDNISVNGNVTCNYRYSSIFLDNDADEVVLMDGTTEMDRVNYDGGPNFPDVTGASMELRDPSRDNNVGSNWRAALRSYSPGNFGSPGAANNRLPVFTSTPLTSVAEDSIYTYQALATDLDNDNLTFNVIILPSWLAFDPVTATFNGTPTNAAVGNHSFAITVSDGHALPVEQQWTVTVSNVNDAPLASNVSATTLEDTEVNVTLSYTDQDFNDLAESATVTNVVGGMITTSLNCTAGICTVGLTPSANSTENVTAEFTVNDGEVNSNTATITVSVTPVNDVPIITSVPAQSQAVEGVSFAGITVTASDLDNNQSDLTIALAQSTLPSWIRLDGSNPLRLVGTPGSADVGSNQYQVIVTDGSGNSAAANFSINVLPTLEILNNSLTVTLNGRSVNDLNNLVVSPGDQIVVAYNFLNNYDRTLGNVQTSARVVSGTDFVNHQGSPRLAVLSGTGGSDQFSFQVPNGATANFGVRIRVAYDNFWSFLPGVNDFITERDLNFNLIRQQASLAVSSAIVSDGNLTCSRTTRVTLEVLNNGQSTLTPQVMIFDKEPVVSSFNPATGQFATFNGGTPTFSFSRNLPPLLASTSYQQTLPIDAANMSAGQHTLYVYVLNPYLNSVNSFIAGSSQVAITVGNCLNRAALEQIFTTAINSGTSLGPIDLNAHITEDTAGLTLTYALATQSNTNLIACQLAGSQLTCPPPTSNQDGESELTFSIMEQNALSPINESFTVRVAPTIAISNLQVNGNAVNEGGATTALRPQQQVALTFTITNHQLNTVTGVNAQVVSAAAPALQTQTAINLAAGASQQITLTGNLPLALVSGTYPVSITIQGQDFVDNTITYLDTFNFNFMIQPSSADLSITNLTLEDETLTCKSSTFLDVELTNRGRNSENDIMVHVTGGNGLDLFLSNPATLSTGTTTTLATHPALRFEIPSNNLSSGSNQLNVALSYRNGAATDAQTVTLTKATCISGSTPTNNVIVAVAASQVFTVELAETGFSSSLRWFKTSPGGSEIEQTSAAGQTTYTFQESTAGAYVVKAKLNDNEARVWQVTVSDRPTSNTLTINVPASGVVPNRTDFPLSVENSFGKIIFTGINLDTLVASGTLDLDSLITIAADRVSVNSSVPGFTSEPARIILKRTFDNPSIQRSPSFNEQTNSNFVACPASICTFVSNANGQFIFDVTGFSTHRVVTVQPAAFGLPSEVFFSDVARGSDVNLSVILQNLGTDDDIDDIVTAFVGVDSRYNAQVLSSPLLLSSGSDGVIELKISVPSNEAAGKHKIGDLQVNGINNTNAPVSLTIPVTIKPTSFLDIKNIRINDKASGDLEIDTENEIEVEIQNNYREEIENIVVTVTIEDVDGEDLDEESDEFDLRAGDDDKVSVRFDLKGERLDDDSYKINIKVEGEATDGTDHEEEKTITVDVKRDNHRLVITRSSLGAADLQCNRQTNLQVTVENVGKSDEDNVEIRVSNSALNLNLKKTNIDIDKFSRSRNDHRARFTLDLEDAAAGTYPINIEIFRDDRLEEEEQVELTIQDCIRNTQNAAPVATVPDTQLTADFLRQQLLARQQEVAIQENVVQTSFRDTDNYLLLLGGLVILIVLALLMALALLVSKRR